jgi:hypothetical protein
MKKLALALPLVCALASPALADSRAFEEVCNSPAVKSAKLIKACQDNQAPDMIKSGERFKNVGIGTEVNTLARNLDFFAKS